MTALPSKSYRYKGNPNRRMKMITFPDPVQEAQIMFKTKPEDMLATHSTKDNFLQSVSDYKNMMSGVDYSNQNLFKSINNKVPDWLPFSGNENEDKTKIDKLKELFKTVTDGHEIGPALLQFLKTPEVKALLSQAGTQFVTQLDSRIQNVVKPIIQDKLNSVIGTPVKVPMSFLVEKFKLADLQERPLFEISMDPAGPNKGLMGIFEELNSKSYFELLPHDNTEYKSSLYAVNEKQKGLQFPLTEDFCILITENMITDNTYIKNQYLDLYRHTIKDKVDDVFSQFKSGQISNYPNLTDEYAIEENKRIAAEQIVRWAKKSIKFREWLAKFQPGDIIADAKQFLEDIDKDEDSEADISTVTEGPTSSRMNLRSDTKKQEQLDQSIFMTPSQSTRMPTTSKVKSEYKLTPEGKKILNATLNAKTGETKKQIKQKIINQAVLDPETYGDYVQKTGSSIKPKVKIVIVPPTKQARFDRIKVILGAIDADSSADYLDEYSAIVDSLLTDKIITKDIHKNLINKYTELANENI